MTRSFAALAAVAALAGCTVLNAVRVCEQPAPAVRESAVRTENSQRLDGATALAALAAGGFLLVSTTYDDATPGAAQARISRLDAQGQPQPYCDVTGELELAPGNGTARPSLAISSARHAPALAVWTVPRGDETVLAARAYTSAGCLRDAVFELDVAPRGVVFERPDVVALPGDSFLVLWTRTEPAARRGTMHARIVQIEASFDHRFAAHASSPTGEAATLFADTARTPTRASAVAAGDRIALVWLESSALPRVRFALLDQALRVVTAPVDVSEGLSPTVAMADALRPRVAWDGTQVAVLWEGPSEGSATAVYARFYDDRGRLLSTPEAPDGAPLRLGGDGARSAFSPSVAPIVPGGGFVVAWTELALDASTARGRIAATVLAPSGAVRFNNRACDAASFVVAEPRVGSYTQPVVGRSGDATLIVFESAGEPGADPSGAGLRSVALSAEALLPRVATSQGGP